MLVMLKSGGTFKPQYMTKSGLLDWMRKNKNTDGTLKEEILLFNTGVLKIFKTTEEKAADGIPWILSDYTVDRDKHKIDPAGWDLKAFKKNPVVLWSHNHYLPAIGKMAGTRVKDGSLGGRVIFAPKEIDEFAWSIGEKVKTEFIRAGSVGFIPRRIEVLEDEKDAADLDIKEQELIEFSICNVPSNTNSLAEEIEAREFVEAERSMEKSVIPFKDLGTADPDEAWDAGKEVAAADVKDLKIMCAWFDSEDADSKGAYKLPHHRQGDKKAVWNGVRPVMGAILGARGGVNIPDGDRKGAYNHIAKHYKQFDKEVPEFKSKEDIILDELGAMKLEIKQLQERRSEQHYTKHLFEDMRKACETSGQDDHETSDQKPFTFAKRKAGKTA